MTSYASSIFDVLSLGAGLASLYRGEKLHKSTLEHDKELHVRGIASSTEQHFQELCAELLTAAKEADRDVWEQRNGQFNNLMLSSTLMFGVAVASIVEGNFNQTVDGHATAWFAFFVACALSFLFVSLVCCMLVSRRMSIYMIMRSSRFVSRLGNPNPNPNPNPKPNSNPNPNQQRFMLTRPQLRMPPRGRVVSVNLHQAKGWDAAVGP